MLSFESDYITGAHPEILKRLGETNAEVLTGYGTDIYTQRAKEKIKKALYIPTFGEEVGNSVSHGVMSILTLIALPFAAVWAYVKSGGAVQSAVGVSIFCISVIILMSLPAFSSVP